MLNSVSDRNGFFSRQNGVGAIYGQNTATPSAGLSSDDIYRIGSMSAINRVGGSNLQLSNLNAISAAPNEFLQKRFSSSTVTLSAPAQVQSSLSTLDTTLKSFSLPAVRNPLKTSQSQAEIATAKALSGGDALAAQTIEVKQLAQGQISQTKALASKDDLLGKGSLTIRFGAINDQLNQAQGGKTLQVQIDSTETLGDLARKIENAQPSLRAAVVVDTQGARLQLENTNTGAEQAFTLIAQEDSGGTSTNLSRLSLDAAAATSGLRVALDAKVSIAGREVQSASNTLSDTASNVQLELKSVGQASIGLERDDKALAANFKHLIAGINELKTQLQAVDAGLAKKTISQIDEVLNKLSVGQGNESLSLNAIGITSSNDGKLIVNETRLSQQALAQADSVNTLFNRAVDQLGAMTSAGLQTTSFLNNPAQVLRNNAGFTYPRFGEASTALPPPVWSANNANNWRNQYGISQYLQISLLR
ncbi:flagellar filament capping protein FliD [Chitinibacter bivalviorum]|uniref:Flagellar filament capping protein FliD n=1 Tax=Chitinibacter bivalviorum TaxID=2739434 RepID=A0A7H9BLZ0_9NEIS|nr:flagellar filament capping protein FliD [Chitinibacter bivalviorum]QLG89700.1 flagellar filament capping protein FliD [Chitinibacter bivalviorum]